MSSQNLAVRNLADGRFRLLAGALALVALTFLVRPLALTRDGIAVLAVVDITGSMNVRDYAGPDGQPASRLKTAKAALRDLVAALPCGSRFALGLFTERRPFLLFAPIETCAGFAPVDGALEAIDWRMAWEGDSRISAGLFRSVALAAELGTDLVFITDGQEAPPLPSGGAAFDGEAGAVRGLIVGAGAPGLSPIPRFNDRGRETGFYKADEVQQENRFGPPPADAESREGHNPRNAPFGAAAAGGTEHLSSVREPYLRKLGAETGLTYVHLDGPAGLASALRTAATPRPVPGRLDLRPVLGAAALLLLLTAFLFPLFRARGVPTWKKA